MPSSVVSEVSRASVEASTVLPGAVLFSALAVAKRVWAVVSLSAFSAVAVSAA